MQQHLSFSKIENELKHKFRKMINESESTEEVKNNFVYCMQELFSNASGGVVELRFEEIELVPEENPPFVISEQIRNGNTFKRLWEDSDLSQIVLRFSELASNHYKHLAKNPQKTESKIRIG